MRPPHQNQYGFNRKTALQGVAVQQRDPTPGLSMKKLSKTEARAKYNLFTGNHPTIHCNRFDLWEKLSHAEQRKWRDPQYAPWEIAK